MHKFFKLNFLYSLLVLFVMGCLVPHNIQAKPNYSYIRIANHIAQLNEDTIKKTGKLILVKLSENTYQHLSFLNTRDFGRVSCNGMLVINDNQAVIFDTPADDESSEELITYVTRNLKSKIIAIIPTHFHNDCVGGMAVFSRYRVQAYASYQTIKVLKLKGNIYADSMQGFKDSLVLNVGNKNIVSRYFGEGHTIDNVIGYFPEDKVLFGGCLIKEIGAGKGNLEDANIKDWSSTVVKLKQAYPDLQIVIPGHGKSGSTALLDYTISLFK